MKQYIYRIACALICAVLLTVSVSAAEMLVPGGTLIGIELSDGSVTVAAIDDATGSNARTAGLQVGDTILAVDDQQIHCAQDVRRALARADGLVELAVERSGKQEIFTVKPQVTADGPKLGVYLRQGISGVGTVTWYDPDTRQFGALGHGVNTPAGELLALRWGSAYDATVAGVQKGVVGTPGQLMGEVDNRMVIGTLSQNLSQGIFGTADTPWKGETIPVGTAGEVHPGQAVIRSTVCNGPIQEYSVEILKIYPNSDDTGRNMLLKITDDALLETTGGIVQGMGVSYNRDNTGNPNSLRGFQVTDP